MNLGVSTAQTPDSTWQDAIKHEYPEQGVTRASKTVLSGANTAGAPLKQLTVMGAVLVSVPTTGTAGTNTGNGTCTGIAGGKSVKPGVYTLTCIAAATDAGSFSVSAPDGARLNDASVGAAYSGEQINFTINDGSTDFAVGDTFTITVAAGSGKVVPLDPDATNGAQTFAGILFSQDIDAGSADVSGAVLMVRGPALVNYDKLVLANSLSSGQVSTLKAEMAAAGIHCLQGA
jgi:hypothetical protein